VIAKTQENCNIVFSRSIYLNENEYAGIYLHSGPTANLGVKASYVILKSDTKIEGEARQKLVELANNLAMHIVAANSKFLKISDVPQDVFEKEKVILEEQSKNVAKDRDHTKIFKSKIDKWLEETCLYEQTYLILDHDELSKPKKISEVIKVFGAEHKIPNLEIKEFKLLI
jgi:translation elongation factor EF-Ts